MYKKTKDSARINGIVFFILAISLSWSGYANALGNDVVRTHMKSVQESTALVRWQSGIIKGRITDRETNIPMLRAVIGLFGTRHVCYSDSNGYYILKDIPEGRYDMIALRPGYESIIKDSVIVIKDKVLSLDFRLLRQTRNGDIKNLDVENWMRYYSVDPYMSTKKADNSMDPNITLFKATNSMDPDISIKQGTLGRIYYYQYLKHLKDNSLSKNESIRIPSKNKSKKKN